MCNSKKSSCEKQWSFTNTTSSSYLHKFISFIWILSSVMFFKKDAIQSLAIFFPGDLQLIKKNFYILIFFIPIFNTFKEDKLQRCQFYIKPSKSGRVEVIKSHMIAQNYSVFSSKLIGAG